MIPTKQRISQLFLNQRLIGTVAIPVMLVFAVMAVYGQVGGFDFVQYDDYANLFRNPHIDTDTFPNLGYFWTHSQEGQGYYVYRPVVYTVSALLAYATRLSHARQISGAGDSQLDPLAFHLLSVVVHAANTVLAYFVSRWLLRKSSSECVVDNRVIDLSCFGGALFFAIHPVQVEAVAWATGLTELLGTLFSLTAVWLYLVFLSDERGRVYSAILYSLASISFFLAVFSKPEAVVTPAVILLVAVVLFRKPVLKVSIGVAPWFALSLAFILLTSSVELTDMRQKTVPFIDRFSVAGDALVGHLSHSLWPTNLAIDYGLTPAYVLGQKFGHAMWLVLLAVLLSVWFAAKKSRGTGVALGIIIVTLLPVLGFVPFRFQSYSTVADRYMYFPMFGVTMLLSGILVRFHRPQIVAVYAAVLIFLAGLCSIQLQTWRTSFTLFAQATSVNPNSWLSWLDLGLSYGYENDLPHAAECFERTLQLNPDQPTAEASLGVAYLRMNRPEEAVIHLQRANAELPNTPYILGYLAQAATAANSAR